eukprot:159868_1
MNLTRFVLQNKDTEQHTTESEISIGENGDIGTKDIISMIVHAPSGYLANVYITSGGYTYCVEAQSTECLSEPTVHVFCNPEDMSSPHLIGNVDIVLENGGAVASTINFNDQIEETEDKVIIIKLQNKDTNQSATTIEVA